MTLAFKVTLKAARVNRGLTQSQMADEMGVSKMTIMCWENGLRAVKPGYLPAISRVLGCPMDCIILPKVITKSHRRKKK